MAGCNESTGKPEKRPVCFLRIAVSHAAKMTRHFMLAGFTGPVGRRNELV